MASPVSSWLEAIAAYAAALGPVRAGLRNSVGDEILNATRTAVESAISQYDNALSAAAEATRALERLKSIGFPTLPHLTVPPEVFANLAENIRQQQAALEIFSQQLGATSGKTSVGEQKPE